VVVTPIGFVCDHVEVLYDLDIEARQIAEQAGINFVRAATVSDHPAFIRALADMVQRRIAAGAQVTS
jgi:ferrochelatase